jgi:magnesium transporter
MVMQSTIPPLDDLVEKHMHREVASLKTGQTVFEALETIRNSPPFSSNIIYFYVVDELGKLQGIMPTRSLLLSAPEKLIDDLMVQRPVAIPTFATIFDACEFFTMYKFLAFPVVNESGILVGMLDIRTYNAEISSMSEDLSQGHPKDTYDALFQLIGVHWEEAKNSGMWTGFSVRFPCLSMNLNNLLCLRSLFLSCLHLQKVLPFNQLVFLFNPCTRMALLGVSFLPSCIEKD